MLRAFAVGWRHERLAKNAEEISDLGKELYQRIASLADHFAALERSIAQTVHAYNKAVGSLETRVLVSARRFRDLGAAGGEPIDELNQVDSVPRHLQADEFSPRPVVHALPDSDDETLPILKQSSSRLPAS
jgi:DNA recombination protein RmuC